MASSVQEASPAPPIAEKDLSEELEERRGRERREEAARGRTKRKERVMIDAQSA